jgi:hypothetical protein
MGPPLGRFDVGRYYDMAVQCRPDRVAKASQGKPELP